MNRLQYIDVVRWQEGEIHVLGRGEECISSDSCTYRAHHIVHDALTGEIISEDCFAYEGNLPLFMCGCYVLTCKGDCPPILDDELVLQIQRNKINADRYDNTVREFQEANVHDMKKAGLCKPRE